MSILLWVLQVLAALLYAASGVMKVFMFDKVSEGVASFGALPRSVWRALGILELVCTVGLIVPAAFHWQPALTVVAAAVLQKELTSDQVTELARLADEQGTLADLVRDLTRPKRDDGEE